MKILIVDDLALNRKLLKVSLHAEGHEMAEAADGFEALERMRSEKFDVVISDILMPRMDGYRFCYEVRRDRNLRDIPIVIYSSTYTSPADERLALDAGADRFVRKPVSISTMLEVLTEVTRSPAARGEPSQPGELQVFKEYSEVLVQRLETSERRFRELVDSAPIGIFQTTPEGRFVSANAAIARMLGYETPEALDSLDFARDVLLEPSSYTELLRNLEGPSGTLEMRLRKREGQSVWVEADGRAVKDDSGRIVRYEIFARDISARKIAEEETRQSADAVAQRWKARIIRDLALGAALTVIFGLLTHRLLQKEEAWLDKFVAGFVAIAVFGVVFSYRRLLDVRKEIMARERGEQALRFLRGDLENRVEARTLELRVANQSLRNEVEERRRAELDLRRSEMRFQRLFDSNTIGIAIADLTGRTLDANQAYLDMLGYSREELLAGTFRWDELTPPEHRARDQLAVEQLLTTGVAQPWEKEFLRKDGARVPVLIGVAMLEASEQSCIAYTVNLSSQKTLEQQFRQAQKMEAVGQLAGGIAHDFNNLLTAILGYADLLQSRPGLQEAAEEIEEIRKAGERAARLTRQLLAFSRQQVLEPVVVRVNDLIANLEKMLGRLIGEHIDLVSTLDAAANNVLVDPGQLEQVIMNLAVNARDAMPSGGKLTIETANVDLDEAYAQRHATVKPGQYVMLAVSDTGIGIDAATQARIFEPFFTTKEKGKGTGLGLSTVYGIVKQSGGYTWLYSEVGKGTTFKIYLPQVHEAAAALPVRTPEGKAPGGHETLLLVEDDSAVRKLSRTLLQRAGYRVLDAESGQAALDLARKTDGVIQLILTDLVMPDMSGTDLVARLLTERPGTRVLFMSGYTDDTVVRHGLLEPGRAFIQKPFSPEGLARKVREVLS